MGSPPIFPSPNQVLPPIQATGGGGGGGGGAGGGGATGGSSWACQHCTFLNQPQHNECEVCHLPKTH